MQLSVVDQQTNNLNLPFTHLAKTTKTIQPKSSLLFFFPRMHSSSCAVRRCSPLFAPDNGYMKCDSDGDNYGATCNFKCTGGYELQGSAARVCQYGLTWSGTDTSCARTYYMQINTCTCTKNNNLFFFPFFFLTCILITCSSLE